MTMPLTHPFVKPTDFDIFLEEIGLAILPQEQRDKIADQAREMASYAVVRKLQERLDPEKQDELTKLIAEAAESNNHVPVNQFLLREIPDIESLTDEAINEVKDLIRGTMADLPNTVDKYKALFTEHLEELSKGGGNEPPASTETLPAANQLDTEDEVLGASSERPPEQEKAPEPFPWDTTPRTETVSSPDDVAPLPTPYTQDASGKTESGTAIQEELDAATNHTLPSETSRPENSSDQP